jgi:uncharacterized protein (UPF0303 family)
MLAAVDRNPDNDIYVYSLRCTISHSHTRSMTAPLLFRSLQTILSHVLLTSSRRYKIEGGIDFIDFSRPLSLTVILVSTHVNRQTHNHL